MSQVNQDNNMYKLAYITAQAPYGKGEAFINEEMLAIKDKVNLFIFPRNPEKEIFHKEAKNLVDNTIWLPLINLKMIFNFLLFLIIKPQIWRIIINIFKHSRTFSILMKNLIVLPKGVYISKIINRMKIEHIHAHWGSTTATMAWIISELTRIPWSFTLHRWDIYENNMLREKVRTASFVRCISEKGKSDLLKIVGNELRDKVEVIHMGVNIPKLDFASLLEGFRDNSNNKIFIMATPANLFPVKGHKYLIEACEILIKKGINEFKCIFYGDGPLKEKLIELVESKNLSAYIEFYGIIEHEALMNLYKEGKVDLVVLPSIITQDGEHEGIPVALMEAMAYGIPVISTNTGGIPELVEGAGIIVPEKDPVSLANAIERCIINREYANRLGLLGYERVMKYFNLEKNVRILIEEMESSKK